MVNGAEAAPVMWPTSVSGCEVVPLSRWELLPSAPGEHTAPGTLPRSGWLPARAPGTVAASAAAWPADATPPAASSPDEWDWWYRCRFVTSAPPGASVTLHLGGLATLVDVWLNGQAIHAGENMFVASAIPVEDVLQADHNELVMRFSALAPALAKRRPRPRWRTRLVAQQNLRWHRTTLLGRMPSWSSAPPPVGPWRPVWLSVAPRLAVGGVRLSSRLMGRDGTATVSLSTRPVAGHRVAAAWLQVAEARERLEVAADGELRGEASIAGVQPWMPHTHGRPSLYPVTVQVELVDGARVDVDLGRTGFRAARLAGDPDEFALTVNDVGVFFRGACWAPLDPLGLTTSRTAYRSALRQLRDAGGNMVRLSGPMYYEADDFYTCCDELGIAVWQDFMFASMDYPHDDQQFARSVSTEVDQLLERLSPHPSVVLLCGNSEVSQQAALLGLPADQWSAEWYEATLRRSCNQRLPDVAYWPSSPSGGALPVHPAAGDSHYQGVGAYRRDFADAELSQVRFASETLSFANVPEPRSLSRHLAGDQLSVQSPQWKAGSPRDRGAGWDFDDIRDDYLRRLFRTDPIELRYSDPERYLALARTTTGEVMARVFNEWRGGSGRCHGGLVWLWRDLRPGAGWGVVDVDGVPKAAYYYLRRAWRPINVLLLDRGMNGLYAAVVNDRPAAVELVLRVSCYARGALVCTTAEELVRAAPHTFRQFSVEAVLGGFRDINHAYRFGPANFDLVVAELIDATGDVIADDTYFPAGLPADQDPALALTVAAAADGPGWTVTVSATRLAQSVHVDIPGYLANDNYFHIPPGRSRRVRLEPTGSEPADRGTVAALNGWAPAVVVLPERDR